MVVRIWLLAVAASVALLCSSSVYALGGVAAQAALPPPRAGRTGDMQVHGQRHYELLKWRGASLDDGDDSRLASQTNASLLLGAGGFLGFSDGEAICATQAVNVRPSPGTANTPIFTASAGEKVTVISGQTWPGDGYTWIYVRGRGHEGYAVAKYFKSCGGAAPNNGAGPCVPDTTDAREKISAAMWALYHDRANGHYTQDSRRWSGINNKLCPPAAPPYSDCSSSVTWCYWTVFGNGPDFINGASWTAGYTGTQISHGKEVSLDEAQVGDLVFYGKAHNDINHVAMYVGGNKVISHGSDPVQYLNIDYRKDRQQIRAYI